MRTIFWNIKNYNDEKLKHLNEIIVSEKPDVFCIAEGIYHKEKGTVYKDNCKNLDRVFKNNKYEIYYTPLFSDDKKIDLNYGFNEYGLNIYYKKETVTLKDSFSFSLQRKNGRIIALKIFHNFQPITFIFVHSISKLDKKDQKYKYMDSLKEMIELGEIAKIDDEKEKEILGDKERIIIIGDFNMDPWETILDNNEYITSSFIRNHNLIKQRTNKSYIFYNPIVEYISNTKTQNLGGTFYKKGYGWSLLDFVLYNTKEGEINFEIITELKSGKQLLNTSSDLKHSFLKYNFDHLPIEINLNIKK